MESSFNIVDSKTFIYDGKSFEFENVKHFYAEDTWEGGDYYDRQFEFEIIMDDGIKMCELAFGKGMFTEKSHNKHKDFYRKSTKISDGLRIYSSFHRKAKYLKKRDKEGVLIIKDNGEFGEFILAKDQLIKFGLLKREFKFYDNKVVIKTKFPFYGSTYTELSPTDISSIEYFNANLTLRHKYRDDKYNCRIKYDFDVFAHLIEDWAKQHSVNVKII
jgi:hypothetical protein